MGMVVAPYPKDGLLQNQLTWSGVSYCPCW
jgi:hypothetical protein